MLNYKFVISAAILTAAAISSAVGIPISGTGVGLNVGDADANWIVSGNPAIVTAPNSAWTGGTAVLATGAQWINVTGDDSTMVAANYTFTQTFDLTGLDASSAWLDVLWSSDNSSTLYLNGVQVGYLPGGTDPNRSYQTNTSVHLASGFVAGANTLEFVVVNGDDELPNTPGPIGLIADVRGEAEAVPEPATMAVLGMGAAAFLRRRRA